MDIIPSDLATFGSEAKNLSCRIYRAGMSECFSLRSLWQTWQTDTKRKLENDVFAAAGIAQKYICALTRLDYQQEAGFAVVCPYREKPRPHSKGLDDKQHRYFYPFITQELFQTGEALYYGLNALSNNMILCDRKQLKNPNGLILGTPGSGKSFAAKRENDKRFPHYGRRTLSSATRKRSISPLCSV